MQAIYARFPDYFIRQRVNIPESGNHTPDLLDEMYLSLIHICKDKLQEADRYFGQ